MNIQNDIIQIKSKYGKKKGYFVDQQQVTCSLGSIEYEDWILGLKN